MGGKSKLGDHPSWKYNNCMIKHLKPPVCFSDRQALGMIDDFLLAVTKAEVA